MPTQLTYPGVYVEEVPSGVRTIMGVATSIAAFVGRTTRGPVSEPVTVSTFGDFERWFGGLTRLSELPFSVRDFFQNGGRQAIVVRLYKAGADPEQATIDANGLLLRAASAGSWGNTLRARVEFGTGLVSPDLADQWAPEFPGITENDLFNLLVRDTAPSGATEEYRNVTAVDSPRRIDTLLENQSRLVVTDGTPTFPTSSHPAPGPGEDIWDPTLSLSEGVNQPGSDGEALDAATFTGGGDKEGLYALEKADIFNLLVIPPYTSDGNIDDSLVGDAAAYCEQRRAMLLVDPRADWGAVGDAVAGVASVGTTSKNAALFFPHIRRPNPLYPNQIENFAPSGAIAGVFARTDTNRGVWKSPAGQEVTIVGAPGFSVPLTDSDIGQLNPLGVNCLRTLPAAGRVVWGSRTLQGNDRLASEWKYIAVRRTAIFLEESLYRGTHWVVFEPNDAPLWAQIRLNITSFMNVLFRQGAFAGTTPKEAFFVKCDAETTTQDDVNLGIVNIVVGFAPLKPAEFVVIKLQQMAGQTGSA